MRIGFIGDIVGRAGRFMVRDHLERVREEFKLDFVIANVENASHGFGITKKNANELFSYGIDLFTGGNHSFDRDDIHELIRTSPTLVPMNYPKKEEFGYRVVEVGGKKLAVINLIGSDFMPTATGNPFVAISELLENLEADEVFVDFHAETTAEKRTLFEFLKGKISMMVGTHTHIATDDFQLSSGTFYITDVGLSGCFDGVIGMKSESPIHRALTGEKSHLKVPEPKECFKILQVVIADLKEKSGFTYKVLENGQVLQREVISL
jgi:metallophosphoesterase (TIGR00282 family)